MKSNSELFSIDDVGTVILAQGDGARKEKDDNRASVVQSMSGDTGNVEANESNLPLMAATALNINESSSNISSAGMSKLTTKKK